MGQQDRGQRRTVTQPLRLLVPQLGKLAQPGSILPVQREQLVKAQPEHAPVEPEAPIERHHRAAQHRHLTERVMLGILLQRLEAPCDVHDLGLRLGKRRRVLIAGPAGLHAARDHAVERVEVLGIARLGQFIVEHGAMAEVLEQQPAPALGGLGIDLGDRTGLLRLRDMTEQAGRVDRIGREHTAGAVEEEPGRDVDHVHRHMGVEDEPVMQPLDLRDQLRRRQLLEVDHVQQTGLIDKLRQEVFAEVASRCGRRCAASRRDASGLMTSARDCSSRLST